MERSEPWHENYKPVWIVWFTHVVLTALESFGTQEEFNKAQSDWYTDIRKIKEESKKASESRRAREDEEALIAQQSRVPRKSLPVPHLVNTFGNAYVHILWGNNRM